MITVKLYNITHIPQNYLVSNPPAPKSVKIELTSNCNFRCEFCSISDRSFRSKKMSWELFEKISKDLVSIGVEEIGLFLIGEPFFDFEILLRAIRYLKQELNFPYVFVTTNGSLATSERVKLCMEAGLDSLKWSCNYANEEQFSKLTNSNSKFFEKVNQNIKNAFEIRNQYSYTTKLYASSIYYNDEQKILIDDHLNKNIIPYVDQHYWLPLYTMGGNAKERENEIGWIPIAGNSGTYDNPVNPIPCWTLFTEGHIMSDGSVTACCADSTGNWTMGNMNDNKFMEIWNCEEFVKLRTSHLSGNIRGTKCEKCALF